MSYSFARKIPAVLALTVLPSAIALCTALPASAANGADIAKLASDNVGKGAGTCSTVNPDPNSLGGDQFETSCTGNNGQAEYWCADFAMWTWDKEGANVSGLSAAAGSFVASGAGTVHDDASYKPQPGDAAVYDYDGNGYAHHVGIVTAVKSDGSIEVANGDFDGQSGDQVTFATTSTVVSESVPADEVPVGQVQQSESGYTISAYVTPN